MGLPGDTIKFHTLEQVCDGYNCECTSLATNRVQGETDSFGAEYHYFCTDCTAKCHKDERENREEECCDWCKKQALLAPIRDWEEGLYGPVYYVCSKCRCKQDKDMQEEYEHLDDY